MHIIEMEIEYEIFYHISIGYFSKQKWLIWYLFSHMEKQQKRSTPNDNNDDRFIVFIVFTARDNCNDDLQIYLADNSYDCCFFFVSSFTINVI